MHIQIWLIDSAVAVDHNLFHNLGVTMRFPPFYAPAHAALAALITDSCRKRRRIPMHMHPIRKFHSSNTKIVVSNGVRRRALVTKCNDRFVVQFMDAFAAFIKHVQKNGHADRNAHIFK